MAEITLQELAALAGEVTPAHRRLADRVRAFAAEHGVDVLEFRPTATPGEWEIRLRIGTPARTGEAAAAPDRARPLREPPEPPFESPARGSEPFTGDGTTDLLRFIAAADPAVRIPDRPRVAAQALAPLSEDQRLRLLPSTIAGDAILSLQHLGRGGDAVQVEDALRQGRESFAAEVRGSSFRDAPDPYLALYDTVAARVRRELGAA